MASALQAPRLDVRTGSSRASAQSSRAAAASSTDWFLSKKGQPGACPDLDTARSPFPTASDGGSKLRSSPALRSAPLPGSISGMWYDTSNNIAHVEAHGPGEVAITDVHGKTAARGTATGAAYMDVRFHDGSESNATLRFRGAVEELMWSNGVRWTRQPLGVHGSWFDPRNAMLTVSASGDKVLIVDSAATVVGQGQAMGQPLSSMRVTFANGVQAVGTASADGMSLGWSYGEQWARIPATAEAESRTRRHLSLDGDGEAYSRGTQFPSPRSIAPTDQLARGLALQRDAASEQSAVRWTGGRGQGGTLSAKLPRRAQYRFGPHLCAVHHTGLF
jgi:hypothetical protein